MRCCRLTMPWPPGRHCDWPTLRPGCCCCRTRRCCRIGYRRPWPVSVGHRRARSSASWRTNSNMLPRVRVSSFSAIRDCLLPSPGRASGADRGPRAIPGHADLERRDRQSDAGRVRGGCACVAGIRRRERCSIAPGTAPPNQLVGLLHSCDAHWHLPELCGRLQRSSRPSRRTGEGGRRHRPGRRGVLLRCDQPARIPGRQDLHHGARHRRRPDLHPHAGPDGDERRRRRLRIRRPVPLGPRHLRPAGGGGLPRRAVRRAAGPHPRGGRDLPQGVAPREPGLRRQVLPAAAARRPRYRAGQIAALDQSPCP